MNGRQPEQHFSSPPRRSETARRAWSHGEKVSHESSAAADSIQQWSREASPEQASLVDPQQVAILSQMRAVRANMLQWEGYQEVVTMLRAIIHLQKELQSEAKRALQDQASEVFDD